MEEQMELFEDGGLKDEGGMVDEESGNDVPNGSTKKEVRDDIPAMLSEGEFVLPADVVRYHGLEKIMQLRDEAKFGLKKMEAMGQMGNSEEATLDDDVPFGPADLIIVGAEPMQDKEKTRKMAQGGVVYAQGGTYVPPSTGIAGYQQSIYQGQTPASTYTPPPSSVAPPTPTPAPASGYLPEFVTSGVTPFTDPSLSPEVRSNIVGSYSGVVGTEDTKFVPEVEDKYTTLKYINKETGVIRDFYFYNGSPVTPIPDGFIPYDESVDEVVDDLESTMVESTQVTTSDDDPFKDLPKPESVDYSTFKNDELRAAFEENSTARLALTAMGVVNPMIALLGRFATNQQQKAIITEMESRGIKPPETKGSIIDNITDMISGIFNKDKETVKQSIIKTEESVVKPSIPNSLTDDDMGLPTEPVISETTKLQKSLVDDSETKKMLANLRAKGIQAAASTSTVQERAEKTGMTPVQTVVKASSNNDDKPTFAGDDYDPRGPSQSGTPGTDSSKVTSVNKAANVAAAKAVEEQQAAGNVESYEQKITRGGGFKQGGLANRKKKKK